jgi:serine O-acetyltransferase
VDDPRRLGESLPSLVDRMVASYFSESRTHHVDKRFLPSKTGIVRVCDLLLELTYPAYVGRHDLSRHNISYHVGELLPKLWNQLCAEIRQCLYHEAEESGQLPPGSDPSPEAAVKLAGEFVESLPDIRAMLAEDVQAHYDGDPAAASTAEVILAYPGLLAITIYRYAHRLYELDVPKLPRIMTEHAHHLTGIDIHPGARIGRYFCIDHGTGVVIGETTDIGDNVKIYQGVTLGALSFPKDERGRIIRGYKRHPSVGNNVTIYASATILGGDTVIGDGAVIGGGVFVTKSVAPGHQLALAPPELKVRPPRPPRPPDKPTPDEFAPDYAI